MSKIEKYIIGIIIFILIVFITSGITYLIVTNKNNEQKEIDKVEKEENTNNSEELNDIIKLTDIKTENNNVIENYYLKLNNKEKNFKIIFNIEKQYDESYSDGPQKVTTGKMGNESIFYHITKIGEDWEIDYQDEMNYLKTTFNIQNFKIIKGKDNKDYLLLISEESDEVYPTTKILYILNDNLEIIDKMFIRTGKVGWTIENNVYPWYEDELNSCRDYYVCHIRVKIENDKIYYLEDILNKSSENGIGYVEEREYTISDNKLNYKVINKYTISDVKYGEHW